jgi:hypothetical protein
MRLAMVHSTFAIRGGLALILFCAYGVRLVPGGSGP